MGFAPPDTTTREANRPEDISENYFATGHLLGDLHGRSFRGGFVTLVGQAANFFTQIGSTAILARLLMPRDFGLLAMVFAITGFVALFKDLGLSTATVQRAEVTHAQVSFLFWVNFALSCGVALLVSALAPAISWFYSEPRLLWVTVVVSANFILGGLTVQHQAILRRRMQFTTLALIDFTSNACGLGVGIAMALLGFSYWSLVGARSATTAANCLQVWITCRWRPSAFKAGVGARPMVVFGRNLTAFNILNYFTRNFDNVLIGRLLGSAPLGIYSKAYGLVLLPIGQINIPISAVILPALSRLQDKPADYKRLFLNATRGLALITVPIVVFSFFFAPDVVLVLLGKHWLSVAHVFQLLGPAALMGAIGSAPNWLCQSLGRTDRQLHFAFVSAPISVAGFIFGIRWGIDGVALSFSLTFTVLFWLFAWYVTKDSPVSLAELLINFAAALLPAAFAALIAVALRSSIFVTLRPFVVLVVSGLVFGISYASIALLPSQTRKLVSGGIAALRQTIRR